MFSCNVNIIRVVTNRMSKKVAQRFGKGIALGVRKLTFTFESSTDKLIDLIQIIYFSPFPHLRNKDLNSTYGS